MYGRIEIAIGVRYTKVALMSEMEQARIKSTNLDYLNKLTKLDLLVIDDFGLWISILINAGIFLKSLTPGMEENQL